MLSRLKLHSELLEILGNNNAYFQPPSSVQIKYPAIIYEIVDIKNGHANNGVYAQNNFYQVTVVDANPESEIMIKMSKFPTARFNKHYTTNSLNHYVFTISYNKINKGDN